MADAEKAIADAKAAYLNEMTEEAKQEFAVQLEQIKATVEAEIKHQQLLAQQYEQQLLKEANQTVKDAYDSYNIAAQDLQDLRWYKTEASYDLAQLQAGVANIQAMIDAEAADLDIQIAGKIAERDAWNNYDGLDLSELKAQQYQLTQKQTIAESAEAEAEGNKTAKKNAFDKTVEVFDVAYEAESTVAAVAALQKYYAVSGMAYVSYDYYELSETESEVNAAVPYYYLTNTDKVAGNQYWTETGKQSLVDELGHKATDTQIATGLYEDLANAEKSAADTKKEYEEKAKRFAELETSVATAKAQIEQAQKALEAADEDLEGKREAEAKAKADYAAVVNDPTVSETKKLELELAASRAEDDVKEAELNQQKAENELEDLTEKNEANIQEFDELETTVPQLQETMNNWNIYVAMLNDEIKSIEKQITEFDENAKLWTAVVAALESDEYAKALADLKTNTAVTEYVTAIADYEKATKNVTEVAKELIVITQMINSGDAYDAEKEIAELNDDIAQLHYRKDQLAYTEFDLDGKGNLIS